MAYDLTPVLIGGTGVARYARELRHALEATGADLRPYALGRLAGLAEDAHHVQIPLRALHAGWRLGVPRAGLLVGQFDVLHSTGLLPPPTLRPVVLTVHDLQALERPDLHDRRQTAIQRRQVAVAGRVARTIAVSRATADALVRHGADASHIAVVHSGLRPLPSPDPIAVGPRFLLAVGTLEARKGLDTLVRAFAAAELDEIELVLAGPAGNSAVAVDRLLAELGVKSRVRRLGRVSDAQLSHLYASCLAFCSPTRGEGFGFTLLEAARAGAPVVASDLPVLREVMDDGYLPVGVDDLDGWVAALRAVDRDDLLRSDLTARGRARVSHFSWSATAEATASIYADTWG